MSQRTTQALSKIEELLASLDALSPAPDSRVLEDTQALHRAVAAFHMEAIRFRMYSVDRNLKASGDPAEPRRVFEELRHVLEEAGFHTRSHSAP
jgi:hypothetical protein